MMVVSTDFGFILVFKSLDDLKEVVNHLSGLLEWIETQDENNIGPPYLYATYNETVDPDTVTVFLKKLKNASFLVNNCCKSKRSNH